ncbi:glycosyltransferase involved in cell wall biosynthesis [Mucilaginibacter yixingensis]|uniref:Glycosyltransferase involved in cell wall biosynthesis n=1 Tax=Mucilaginibacter yixingensis TaxID=1295612 RepID=A0A2T5JC05_9SPHI|nr:glycosyltransferase family 1 protein [Mucilaginibacter yixingensis]PTQ99312.1 glycosyltransferase involved in cell wall biosynthesis [Mucilaginibacter yixingensis]
MKIGFDAKRAFLNNTGLGNYSRWLITSLASFYPNNSYHLYTTRSSERTRIFNVFTNIHTTIAPNKTFAAYWRSRGIIKDLKRDGIDVYHGLSHELPSGIHKTGIKSVVTVHDVIALRFPQYFSAINRYIYNSKLKYACRVADKVVAISERTKQDLVEMLQVDAGKIAVIYQSCDASFKTECTAAQKQSVKEKYQIPDKYILSVGTIEERKNLLLLINALPQVKDIPLVVIGKQTDYADKVKAAIAQHNLSNRVIFLDRVDFADLPAIYQQAQIFVYPSRYEGFGIPILEALCSGTPVIAATGSCLEEAGGPDSLYVAPDDVNGLAAKLMIILGDETLRQKMITRGKEYSRNFDDDKLAAQMMAVYPS